VSLEADADAYVASVAAHHGGELVVDDVVMFVDFRERELIAALRAVDVVPSGARIVVGSLDTGDVIVARVVAHSPANARAASALDECVTVSGGVQPSALLASHDDSQLEPIVAYERKTSLDLVQSKQRLSDVPAEEHIAKQLAELADFCAVTGAKPALLLEGYIAHSLTGAPVASMAEEHVHRLLVRIFFANGFPTWQSNSVADSARHLHTVALLTTRLNVRASSWVRLPRDATEPAIRVRKARNADVDRYYLSCLQAMPMMSEERARVVVASYPNIALLVEAIAASDNPVAMLASLRVNAGRRLGKALAKSIVARYRRPTMSTTTTTTTTTTTSSSAPPAKPVRRLRLAAETKDAPAHKTTMSTTALQTTTSSSSSSTTAVKRPSASLAPPAKPARRRREAAVKAEAATKNDIQQTQADDSDDDDDDEYNDDEVHDDDDDDDESSASGNDSGSESL